MFSCFFSFDSNLFTTNVSVQLRLIWLWSMTSSSLSCITFSKIIKNFIPANKKKIIKWVIWKQYKKVSFGFYLFREVISHFRIFLNTRFCSDTKFKTVKLFVMPQKKSEAFFKDKFWGFVHTFQINYLSTSIN